MSEPDIHSEAFPRRRVGIIRILGDLFAFLLVAFLTVLSRHFVSELLSLGVFAILLVDIVRPTSTKTAVVYFCLWAASLCSPLDFAIRGTGKLQIRWVSVICNEMWGQKLSDIRSRGAIKNRDYIVYGARSELVDVKWAILLGLPTDGDLRTPFSGGRP